MVMELPMQMPMCDLDTEKTQLEESLLRCANFQMENSEKQMKEIAIKLFAVSYLLAFTENIMIAHILQPCVFFHN